MFGSLFKTFKNKPTSKVFWFPGTKVGTVAKQRDIAKAFFEPQDDMSNHFISQSDWGAIAKWRIGLVSRLGLLKI